MTTNNDPTRRKKTKLEKIAELESEVKILKDKNSRYERKINSLNTAGNIPSCKDAAFAKDGASVGDKNGNEEKLKEAL